MTRLLHIFSLVLLPGMLLAQKVTFEATVEPRTVVVGSDFKVSFNLKNAGGGTFTAPDLSAFTILMHQPESSFSFGAYGITKSIAYTYYLRPKTLGTFTIGAAKVKVGNQTLKTKPLTVKVVKPGAPGTPGALLEKIKAGKGIFLSAEVSHPDAYLGQQIIVDYKLYTSVGLERYNILSESSYPGFYAKNIQRFDSSVKLETIEGEQYRTKVLQRVALFPQKTGLLTIDPMKMNVSINIQRSRRPVRQNIASDPVDVRVAELPTFNQPASFSGAIGYFQFESFSRNTKLSTDDAFLIGMTWQGQGDVKQIQAPKLDLGPDFEVYDPEENESIYQEAGLLAGTKTFQYMVLPKKPGHFQFIPKASYFDIDSMRYIQITDPVIDILVRKGQNPLASEEPIEEEVDVAPQLVGARATDRLRKRHSSFFGSIGFILLSMIPMAFMAFAWLYKQRLLREAGIDPNTKKQLSAKKVAQQRLVTAKAKMEANDPRAFYDEIANALWNYLSDKLQIPASELSKQNISSRLAAAQVDVQYGESIKSLLQTCEMALFAGFDQSAKMPEVYETSVNLISELEDELTPSQNPDA
ncbi:MAG: BatD family protein [Bacteroidota bacterium]